jgi:hypothetical protein
MKTKTKYEKYLTGAVGMIWVAGLLIAGSDSEYMPWVNTIGLILFFIASLILGKRFQSSELNTDFMSPRKLNRKIGLKRVKPDYSKFFVLKTS